MMNRCYAPEIQTLRIVLLKFLVLPILGLSCAFFFPPPLLFVIGVIDIIFLLEVVINTLVTGVLIVGCEISVDAFKTSDQPHFIAC